MIPLTPRMSVYGMGKPRRQSNKHPRLNKHNKDKTSHTNNRTKPCVGNKGGREIKQHKSKAKPIIWRGVGFYEWVSQKHSQRYLKEVDLNH